ncbi:hypothetical protein L227DRAFT_390204 [Lentinus tigrinus ALCF2SS1-6]|uniref:DUF6535 domain-containing protein n=1 Tax=Lentinus tigrinus ALCF2SS1-6 TaxID=1328759 RepID=A0A5C2SID3_9APHY|nr:hypothetical protein L227DRAFT_390204 [Lentinus tigrinus ALCF2SS1-6]
MIEPQHAPPPTLGTGDGLQPGSPAGGGIAQGGQPEVPSQNPEQRKREPPEWETAETLEEYWEARKTFFTHEEHAEAWKKTSKNLEAYSDKLVERWNTEIDTLLVFAGLFSAILTAFNVQSYQLLTPPPPDPVLIALERISAQLSSFSINPPSVNSTAPAFVNHDPTPPPPPRYAVWLNALWFSSLIYSLSAASIGIMVKQWLNEYNAGLTGTPREIARLRQLRMDSLKRWRVKEIVAMLPVLLQIASAHFFAGLLVLLWQLDRTVAIIGSVLVGVLVIFSLTTIILPSVTTHCSYISPSSRALFVLTRSLPIFVIKLRYQLSSWIVRHYIYSLPLRSSQQEEFRQVHSLTYRVWKLLHPEDSSTGDNRTAVRWDAKERTVLSRLGERLDVEVIATSYTATMDTNYLRHATVCMTDMTMHTARQCSSAIRAVTTKHWGDTEEGRLAMDFEVHPAMWSGTIVALMTVDDDEDWPQASLADDLADTYTNFQVNNRHVQSGTPLTRLFCVDLAHIIRHYGPSTSPLESMNFAVIIGKHGLRGLMQHVSEISLGNDVRQHIAELYLQEIRQGLDRRTVGGLEATTDDSASSTCRALHALRCIVYCVPSLESPDYEHVDYQTVQKHAVDGLDALSTFLSRPEAYEFDWDIDCVFDVLRKHGERAMLISQTLVQAIVDYRDAAYKRKHGDIPWYWYTNEEWIQKLKRDFKLENYSEQTSAAASVASTSTSTDSGDLPQVQTVPAPMSDGILGARGGSPLAGVDSDKANPEAGRSPTTSRISLWPSGPLESSAVAEPTPTLPEADAKGHMDVIISCLSPASSSLPGDVDPALYPETKLALHGQLGSPTILPPSSSPEADADSS